MNKKITISFLIVIIIFALAIFLPNSFSSAEKTLFKVERGEGSKEIANNLKQAGLIRWAPLFRVYVLTMTISGDLKAGTYRLSSSMNMPKIAHMLADGKIAQETITIIEGWNLKDIAWYFENKGMFQAEELFELNDNSWQGGLEGYLFPDTYIVNADESLQKIINRMKDNFDLKTVGLADKEALTMASLIEKEVRNQEDKEIVSGILWKRLRAGVPLQVDATIIYITGKKTSKVSTEDTQVASDYNTYLHYGLPPGPIGNPGLESIEAALNPKDSPYWYYLSTPEGETIFSQTLQEHNIAKAKYLSP
ncbi:MAG: endolytic transglycosylase MltG [Candidatus Nealsonbacteria bacterium]|nr:endolytic transglycosylase MltG [Candidatus Nealsonbacteria bacterium]